MQIERASNRSSGGFYAARRARTAGIPTLGILYSDDPFYRGILDKFVVGRKDYHVSALACVSSELERQVIMLQPLSTVVKRIPKGKNCMMGVPHFELPTAPGRASPP